MLPLPSIRDLLDRISRPFGVSIHRWPPPHTVLRHLQLLFERRGIDAVVDVGANRGQFVRALRDDIRFKGWVFSFEPHPDLGDSLRSAANDDPRWHVETVALGRERGTLPFFLTNQTDNSSLLRPNEFAEETFGHALTLRSETHVEVRTLAQVVPPLLDQAGVRSPFLKVDTQGYDLEVLAGAEEALSRFEGVLVEAALKQSYYGAPDITETLDFLRRAGFDPTGFFPVVSDVSGGLVEVDIVSQRRNNH
jgi:FkbM family methyltransferase